MDTRSAWRPRPALSRLVRVAMFVVPVVAGVAAGVAGALLLPRPDGAELVWWAAIFGIATLVLLGTARFARGAIPLAWLLRLSAAFPGRAPSRLRIALRATSIARVRSSARGATAPEPADDDKVGGLVALAAALSAHDRRTRAHSERVRALTRVVGEQLQLAGPAVQRLEWAAFLHDIGKLTVPPAILNKAGRPNPEEWTVLTRHPDAGARLAAPLVPWLGDWLRGVGDHHERWDGSGYPNGVAGADISLAGRIVSVTDAFETMTAVQSYRQPMRAGAARNELAACAGSHFDPSVVRAFLDVSLRRLYWILGPGAWLTLVPLVGRLPRAVATTTATRGAAQLARGLRAVAIVVAAAGLLASIALAVPTAASGRATAPSPAVARPARTPSSQQ